jgi:CDP-paratose 2-epimerase
MKENYLITGGAGFIGTNVADFYLSQNKRVTIFDNLSRSGTEDNVRWLKECYRDQLTLVKGDVRSLDGEFSELVEQADVVLHLAAQVAVTTSVTDPAEDFEINARGTFNVLEAVRKSASRPIVLYSSTNKVYGKMDDLDVVERGGRYVYTNLDEGVAVTRPLDFYSPYGCSKGCGDQYVIDYARIYGLKTVVFRQSCIYGPHQFGIEDQGWVAWFAIRAMQNLPFTIYGDGKQVRDVLYIGDLIAAYDAAIANIEKTSGRAYNIGGGPANTLSLLELVSLLQEQFGRELKHDFDDWRPGDQLVFISDIREAKADFNWEPRVNVDNGVTKLVDWLSQNKEVVSNPIRPRQENLLAPA